VDSRLGHAVAVAAALAALTFPLAHAQQGDENAASMGNPPPVVTIPPENEAPAPIIAPPPANETAPPAPASRTEEAAKPPPPPPTGPVRSPSAILRVLDKVTAETLRFEAPVGRRVRYKSLIFMVKACETRGVRDPLPRPSAYLVIDSQPPAPPGYAAPEAREVYRGWMFADSPGLHPFEHPVYDAWLESCSGAAT